MRSADRPPPVATLRLGQVVGVCGLAALLAAARPARATEIEAPITATVTASSSSAAVARALDADALTRWCPASEDARGELTLRFARPVKIKKVTVLVGKHDLRMLTPFTRRKSGPAWARSSPRSIRPRTGGTPSSWRRSAENKGRCSYCVSSRRLGPLPIRASAA